jgi:hypothetical protein
MNLCEFVGGTDRLGMVDGLGRSPRRALRILERLEPRQLKCVLMVASRRATALAPVVAGMSDCASALAAQRTWKPEAGQDAGVEKLRDCGDPFAFEG